MQWHKSADETDETPRANSNARTETVPNIVILRDYLEFYWSTPGKTTAARGRGVQKRSMLVVRGPSRMTNQA
ncbi:MAG TPA: hypothetical protein VJ760_07645, partial [Nitrospiraceae bacterium]|nr:hypothetical protein [Nitrospiraceae bacterium]